MGAAGGAALSLSLRGKRGIVIKELGKWRMFCQVLRCGLRSMLRQLSQLSVTIKVKEVEIGARLSRDAISAALGADHRSARPT